MDLSLMWIMPFWFWYHRQSLTAVGRIIDYIKFKPQIRNHFLVCCITSQTTGEILLVLDVLKLYS